MDTLEVHSPCIYITLEQKKFASLKNIAIVNVLKSEFKALSCLAAKESYLMFNKNPCK